MLEFSVNESLCTRCGLCVSDCVSGIIEHSEAAVPSISSDAEEQCLRCQHCLAICPEGAISILGKSPEDSLPMHPSRLPSFDQLAYLVRARRSIRHYKHENVDKALLDQILTTLAHVQTGANACALTFSVVDDIEVMKGLQQKLIAKLRAMDLADLPERYQAMLQLSDESLIKRLFRTAPHVIVASTPPTVPCPSEDTALAIANFELLAKSAGLGSVWWGYIRRFADIVPGTKSLFGVPEDHVMSAALFGYPAVEYARTVQKADAAVIKRIAAD